MKTIWVEFLAMVVMVAHIFICPYSKVEESFNIQALHDLIYHRTNISQYDHLEFPGVVPRTFVGPIFVVMASAPYVAILNLLQVEKVWVQMLVRAVLGFMVLMGLFSFATAIRDKFGERTAQLLLVITMSQFHFMFYMSRTLPNVFALVVVLLAVTAWLQQQPVTFICLSGTAILLFRSELCLYLGILLLMDLVSGRVSMMKVIRTVIPAGLVLLGLTFTVDSYFWQRYVWPEGEVLWYNAILNKSSQWGTSPFLWYFYSALPRSLSFSLFLVPLGLYMSSPLRQMVLPALVFVFLYSFLPHKELRFIIYVIPICNVAVADTVNKLWINRNKSVLKKILAVLAILHIAGNLVTTGVFLYTSHHNYPGGEALYRLHQLESQNTPVHVHIDVATAQTGVTRFTQLSSRWIYNKTEDLTPGGDDMMSYTHIIMGDSGKLSVYEKTHIVMDKMDAFYGISFDRHAFPFLHFKLIPKIWILKKQ